MASHGTGSGAGLDTGSVRDDKADMRILVLGGTTEASGVVSALSGRSDLDVTLSLAGRTSDPKRAPVPTRIGGFGGVAGLTEWLKANRSSLLVDATHPFAATMSRNAAEASDAAGVPLLIVRRPPWRREAGDRWIEVDTVPQAVTALGPTPRRVFLTIGRIELGPFLGGAPQHSYVVRTIEPIAELVPPSTKVTAIMGRGPFAATAEEALMAREKVDVLVTKNSGGEATYGKIAAARALGLPVVIVGQPEKPRVAAHVANAAEAVSWIDVHWPPP